MQNLLTDSFVLPKKNGASTSVDPDIELGIRAAMGSVAEAGLDGFFEQIQEIEKLIQSINELLTDLQDANEESKRVTRAAAMKEIKKRMEKDIDEVKNVARLAKAKLEKLDRDNIANREKPGCGKGSSVDRTRTSTTVASKKKLKDRISQFQVLREAIQKENREVVERRVYTVTGQHPDEATIDKLIETGDGDQIFQKAIQEQGRGRIIDTLQEIQERTDTVKEIERKLIELQQVFLDMAVLVEAQGELLDNIEANVGTAVEQVNSGVGVLQKAKSLQKSSRKWMCFAIILLLVIVAVILLAVFKPWQKGNA